MKKTFADTSYWVAVFWFDDQWRDDALKATAKLGDSEIVTTETILIEVLNYFSEFKPLIKEKAAAAIESLLQSDEILVLQHHHEDFLEGLKLYKSRLDKGYSLTDCISMNQMREFGIREILTNDAHFNQEGFIKLF